SARARLLETRRLLFTLTALLNLGQAPLVPLRPEVVAPAIEHLDRAIRLARPLGEGLAAETGDAHQLRLGETWGHSTETDRFAPFRSLPRANALGCHRNPLIFNDLQLDEDRTLRGPPTALPGRTQRVRTTHRAI